MAMCDFRCMLFVGVAVVVDFTYISNENAVSNRKTEKLNREPFLSRFKPNLFNALWSHWKCLMKKQLICDDCHLNKNIRWNSGRLQHISFRAVIQSTTDNRFRHCTKTNRLEFSKIWDNVYVNINIIKKIEFPCGKTWRLGRRTASSGD